MDEDMSTLARARLLVVACGCAVTRPPVVPPAASPPALVVAVGPGELLVRPRIWTVDEARRDAPTDVPRWHIYDAQRSAMSSHPTAFPKDGALLFAFAGVPLDPAAHYAVIDDAGFVGMAAPTGDPCPPGQRVDLPCTFGDDVHGYARIDPAPALDRMRDGAIAIGPWHGDAPIRARRIPELGWAPGSAGQTTLDLLDLDGDGTPEVATSFLITDGSRPRCGHVLETLVRDHESWFAVEWTSPECEPREPWSDWLLGWRSVDPRSMNVWVGDPTVDERLALIDRRGMLTELEVEPITAHSYSHGHMVGVRALRSPSRRPDAVTLAIGPSEATVRARVLGGLFARPHPRGIAFPRGDEVLYRIDLDGDRRSDLEARSRDCWTTDVESAHVELCIEIVRRDGDDWRVIARDIL